MANCYRVSTDRVVLFKPIGVSQAPRHRRGALDSNKTKFRLLLSPHALPALLPGRDGMLLAQSSGAAEYVDKQDRGVEDLGVCKSGGAFLFLERCDGDVFLEVEARREKVCNGKGLVIGRETNTVFMERMLGEKGEDSTWSAGRRGERVALNELLCCQNFLIPLSSSASKRTLHTSKFGISSTPMNPLCRSGSARDTAVLSERTLSPGRSLSHHQELG
ncbi:hypothetical protein EDD18DRAFT_1333013 [Armillaria luteobubalina]|uniref:Uncharacterized protein n=1 Tax=Armillaria luteobubalina TaxID=153913 RepID=A0AA39Q384_9AGAR|nr:hypothetical protein EDD18DRAFT_1333013 [Armillaria luteobubalina]